MNAEAARSIRGDRCPLLVFVHIPKTAGTTLNSILAHRYPPEEIQEIMMRGMSLRVPRRTFFPPSLVSFSKLRKLKAALGQPGRIAVVHGHMDLSISGIFPADAEYITLLRDPVQRAVSHFQHYRRRDDDPVHELAMRSSLAEWVDGCGLVEMDNGQTRRLAGAMGVPFGGLTVEVLDRAKRNLASKFSIVGLTERFEEFQLLMHRRFGWPYHRYPALNVGRHAPSWADPGEEALSAVRARNSFDLELYRYARERLEGILRRFDVGAELARLRSSPAHISAA